MRRRASRVLSSGPSSKKTVCQAMVRMRNEVKKGITTNPSRSVRQRPARKART
jgi:hypothetical protein